MLYVLCEHATGYGLFHVQEVEEVGALLPTVERAITDAALFKTIVKLVAFSPFKSGTNALDNVNAVSEGIVHDDLKLFLETNFPTGKKGKKSGAELGVSDTRITATIQDELGIKCAGGDAVTEIIRGLRLHFSNLVKGLSPLGEAKAQLGLGHSYSRAKVKFNVHRADNMIIQSIALLDQLDKDINTFSMRVREWYSYHFPELVKIVNENYMYCRMVKLIGNRKLLLHADDEFIEKMDEITMDSAKSKAIVEASKMSMGMDISPIDLINIESFSARVISLTDYRKSLVTYLHERMGSVAPNLSSLIGDMVGARLISHAGSLTNLAKYPASTVQILGAEKALFRALKTKGNTPKYGLIFHSTFIGRAAAKNKGRISRFLANKCSMASRIDCFSERPSNIFGEKLKEQVEERLKFFETGDTPRKNVDVMKEALEEFAHLPDAETSAIQEASEGTGEKKKKKKKKRKSEADDALISQIAAEEATPSKVAKIESPTALPESSEKKKKKKKKGGLSSTNTEESMEVDASISQGDMTGNDESILSVDEKGQKVKEKKKKKIKAEQESTAADTTAANESAMSVDEGDIVKKEKKKKKVQSEESMNEAPPTSTPGDKKKKKKKLNASIASQGEETHAEEKSQSEETVTTTPGGKKKKKKKQQPDASASSQETEEVESVDGAETPKKTKKKKKKKQLDGSVTVSAEETAVKVNGSSHEENGEQISEKKIKKKKKKLNASVVSEVGETPAKKAKSADSSIDISAIGDDAETPKKVKKAKKKKVAAEQV